MKFRCGPTLLAVLESRPKIRIARVFFWWLQGNRWTRKGTGGNTVQLFMWHESSEWSAAERCKTESVGLATRAFVVCAMQTAPPHTVQ